MGMTVGWGRGRGRGQGQAFSGFTSKRVAGRRREFARSAVSHLADLVLEAVAAHLNQRSLAFRVVLDVDRRAGQLLSLEPIRLNLALITACHMLREQEAGCHSVSCVSCVSCGCHVGFVGYGCSGCHVGFVGYGWNKCHQREGAGASCGMRK